MRIALLTDGVFPYVIGGMQKHSFYLAKFLVLRGHEVTLVHAIHEGKQKPTEEEVKQEMALPLNAALRVKAVFFPRPGFVPGHYLKESYTYSARVYESIKNELNNFDIIYAKGFSAWHILSLRDKGRITTPPIGVKFHGYEMFQKAADWKSRLQHWLLRGAVKWNNQKADFVLSYGSKISDIIAGLGVHPENIDDIPTGIDSQWLTKNLILSQPYPYFVFIGRYERRKGIAELNEVLQEQPIQGIFHFIGPIPESKKIKKENIIYHGSISDSKEIQNILDQCQVLVVPSWSEGMPNVILEGMARGLAVIATDVGAVSQMVGDDNGWLIEAGNTEMLKETMFKVSSTHLAALVERRESSIKKVENNFLWEIVAGKVEESLQKRMK